MAAPKGHQPYAGCETGGREKIYTQEFIEKEADAFEEWLTKPSSVYFKEFAFERGYSYKRLTEFAQVNQKFLDTFQRAKDWQEQRLVKGGLNNTFNAGFTKFVMGNACGWWDRQETRISGDAENPLQCVLGLITGKSKELVDEDESE